MVRVDHRPREAVYAGNTSGAKLLGNFLQHGIDLTLAHASQCHDTLQLFLARVEADLDIWLTEVKASVLDKLSKGPLQI